MSVRRKASQDLVLAAFCVAAITLGLWPNEPTRQMIHSLDRDGNTSSYSLSLDDSRLARLSREIDRRRNPPPTREIVLAKWRMDLAGHYARRLDPTARRGAITPETTAPAAQSGGVPIVQVGFSSESNTQTAAVGAASANPAQIRELEFWREISAKSELLLETANQQVADQIASLGPPSIVLGNVFQPSKSSNAWITAILLGLLASCVFADWQTRSPKIVITQAANASAAHSDSAAHNDSETYSDSEVWSDGTVRLQIPIEWIRIHQPVSVQLRRLTLVGLVLAAASVQLASFLG